MANATASVIALIEFRMARLRAFEVCDRVVTFGPDQNISNPAVAGLSWRASAYHPR